MTFSINESRQEVVMANIWFHIQKEFPVFRKIIHSLVDLRPGKFSYRLRGIPKGKKEEIGYAVFDLSQNEHAAVSFLGTIKLDACLHNIFEIFIPSLFLSHAMPNPHYHVFFSSTKFLTPTKS